MQLFLIPQWDGKNHIAHIEKKLYQSVGFLSRCWCDFAMRLKLIIYHTVFQSHVNYCHLVWGLTSKTNFNRLLVLQKKAVRHIVGISYREHTRDFFVQYNIISITTTFEYRLLYYVRFSPPAVMSFWNLLLS